MLYCAARPHPCPSAPCLGGNVSFRVAVLLLLFAVAPSHAATPARLDQVLGHPDYATWQRALEKRREVSETLKATAGVGRACGADETLRQATLQAHEARMRLLQSLRDQGLSPVPPPAGVAPWPWSAAAGQTPVLEHFDRDNVSVLVDDGTLVFINLRANPEVDVPLAARAFYDNHDDEYDLFVLFTDFFSDLLEGQYRAYHMAVANQITGLGYQNTLLGDFFNDRRQYTGNTQGLLQSSIHLNDIHLYPENPDDPFLRSYSATSFMMHELSHRWLARLYVWIPLFGPQPVLLGRGNVHWGFFANSGASFNEGVQWVPDGDGFRTVAATSAFGQLDLYMMGLLAPSEIDESQLFYLQSPTDLQPALDTFGEPWNAWSPPQEDVFCRATRVDFDMDSVFLGNGVRRPVAPHAPTQFKVATVLVVPGSGTADLDASIGRINAYQQRLSDVFHAQTMQRGTLEFSVRSIPARVDLLHHPHGDVEQALQDIPIETAVHLEPRSLPTSLDDVDVTLFYRLSTGVTTSLPMMRGADDLFRATIPGQPMGSHIEYWLRAGTLLSDHETTLPANAPNSTLSFEIAPDTQAPTIQHVPVDHHARSAEPLLVRALVRDTHTVESVLFEYRLPPGDWIGQEMQRQGGSDVFEARVTLPGRIGSTLDYRIVARDQAASPNVRTFPESGVLPLQITATLFEDAEVEDPLWTHRSLLRSGPDQWHREPQNRTPGGHYSWKLGPDNVSLNPRAGRMALELDAALETPAMRLTPDWSLTFYHRYYLRLSPPDTGYSALDGAVVQWQDIESTQDVLADRWYPIEPVDGYPKRLSDWAFYNPLWGNACWSGDQDSWRLVRFDHTGTYLNLAGRMVRFRFRGATTPAVYYDLPRAGWYVDDITLDPGSVPTAIGLQDLRARRDASTIELLWTARDVVTGESFRVERSVAEPDATWGTLASVVGRVGVSAYSYRDETMPPGRNAQYRVTLMRDGIEIASQVLQVQAVPYRFTLRQNTPNPFNPRTRIAFELAERQHASLAIFDVRGRRVRTLVSETLDAGPHWRDWDGTDGAGRHVASGVYLYRLTTRAQSATHRMLLLQ
jgi:hypothetical protein